MKDVFSYFFYLGLQVGSFLASCQQIVSMKNMVFMLQCLSYNTKQSMCKHYKLRPKKEPGTCLTHSQ